MIIHENVAVEALNASKWVIVFLIITICIAMLLPGVLPRITKANLFNSVELEFRGQYITAVEEKIKEKYKGAPEDIRKLLIRSQNKLIGSSVLWIDNHPASNTAIRNLFEETGVRFEVTVESSVARNLLNTKKYDLIISDNSRGKKNPTGGLDFFVEYRKDVDPPPWIFFSWSLGEKIIDGASLSTNNPYLLIHKMISILSNSHGVELKETKHKMYTVPWWFYCILSILIIITFAFMIWIIRSSMTEIHQVNTAGH